MRDQVPLSLSKGRHEIPGLAARGGWQQFGCRRPSTQDLFVVHRVGVGIAQPEGRQSSSSNGRANSLVELQEPEPRKRVRGVVGQSECCQQILDVGGLDKPQAPILDIRNSSTPELKFEQIRVVCGPHQHRLFLEGDAFFTVRKELLADRRNLSILVSTSDEAGAHSGLTVRGVKYSGESLWSFRSHAIGHVENLLARSVIGVEDHRPRSRKHVFEI